MGCGWLLFHKSFWEAGNHTWLSRKGYQDEDPNDQYIIAFYFSLTTVTTVGYGDFVATSTAEMIYSMFSQLIGVMVFSYVSGSLASLLTNSDASNSELDDKLQKLDKIHVEHNLDTHLYEEIKLFIQF
jgi:hypothetical protein